jgi:hypothetical protein
MRINKIVMNEDGSETQYVRNEQEGEVYFYAVDFDTDGSFSADYEVPPFDFFTLPDNTPGEYREKNQRCVEALNAGATFMLARPSSEEYDLSDRDDYIAPYYALVALSTGDVLPLPVLARMAGHGGQWIFSAMREVQIDTLNGALHSFFSGQYVDLNWHAVVCAQLRGLTSSKESNEPFIGPMTYLDHVVAQLRSSELSFVDD